MALTFNKTVVRAAFDAVLGTRVPDPDLTLAHCAEEFSGTYRSLGVPEAFKAAVVAFAPTIDGSAIDGLFVRFETALKDAQDEADLRAAEARATREQKKAQEQAARERAEEKAEQREARERADREKADEKTEARTEKQNAKQEAEELQRRLNDTLTRLEGVRRDGREVYGLISADSREARKLSRESENHASVEAASQIVTDLYDEATRLVNEMDQSAREARGAARDKIEASVLAEASTVDQALGRLNDLRTKAQDALEDVRTAVANAATEKAAAEKAAAIKKAVDDAKADLDAFDGDQGFTTKMTEAIRQYKVDTISQTGNDPIDNPDALATTVSNARAAAETANNEVGTAAAAEDKDAAEAAAQRVAGQRKIAQAALDDINGRARTLQTKKQTETAKDVFVATKKEKAAKEAEEKKKEKDGQFDRFLSSLQGHLILWAVFIAAGFLALMYLPWQLQIVAVVVALGTIIFYGFSLLKGRSQKAAGALGGFSMIVGVLILFLFVAPLIGKGPGSDRDINILGGDDPTPTATVAPTPTPQDCGADDDAWKWCEPTPAS